MKCIHWARSVPPDVGVEWCVASKSASQKCGRGGTGPYKWSNDNSASLWKHTSSGELTVASTSIEFGPCPLIDFEESDPNVSGVTVTSSSISVPLTAIPNKW